MRRVASALPLADAMRERGVEHDGEPQDRPWGNREWPVSDPDGIRLCFASVLSRLSPDRRD